MCGKKSSRLHHEKTDVIGTFVIIDKAIRHVCQVVHNVRLAETTDVQMSSAFCTVIMSYQIQASEHKGESPSGKFSVSCEGWAWPGSHTAIGRCRWGHVQVPHYLLELGDVTAQELPLPPHLQRPANCQKHL